MSKAAGEPRELADALHSTAVRLLRTVRWVDRETGLSPARLSALSVLVFAGPLHLGRLAAAEGVKSPTMTGIVNGLVEEGLVERRPAADDSRAVQVAVTPQGRLLFHAARQRRVDEVSDLLAGLTGPELRQLEDTVRILQRVLGTA